MPAAAIVAGAVIGGGASLIAGSKASKATKNAAQLQQQSTDAAVAEQQRQFNTILNLTQPTRDFGNAALDPLSKALGIGGAPDNSVFQNLPGRQFAVNDATQQALRAASAGGGINSGNTVDAITRSTGAIDANFIQNYIADLLTSAGLGSAANNNAANTAYNTGAGIAGTINAGGTNQANIALAGGQNAANTVGNVSNTLTNALQNYLFLNQIKTPQANNFNLAYGPV